MKKIDKTVSDLLASGEIPTPPAAPELHLVSSHPALSVDESSTDFSEAEAQALHLVTTGAALSIDESSSDISESEDSGLLPAGFAQGRGMLIIPRAQKLLEQALAIESQSALQVGQVGFMARALVQATIPHSDPGKDVPAWGRKNGDLSLVIRPGYTMDKDNQPVSMGYPYGSVPRLLLSWLSTEAVRTKEREIVLGKSLTGFMTELGLKATGGKNGTITRLREQMRRLFSSTISINYSTNIAWSEAGFRISDTATLFWDLEDNQQAGLWQSSVTLSENFFKEVIQHPVPVDLRVLRALRQSPLALDIYAWLTYRMFYLKRPTLVTWDGLMRQLGSDYKETRMFKRRFLDALKQVTAVYPLQLDAEDGGLRLHPGKPHVPRYNKAP
jgi:hypothetical protein